MSIFVDKAVRANHSAIFESRGASLMQTVRDYGSAREMLPLMGAALGVPPKYLREMTEYGVGNTTMLIYMYITEFLGVPGVESSVGAWGAEYKKEATKGLGSYLCKGVGPTEIAFFGMDAIRRGELSIIFDKLIEKYKQQIDVNAFAGYMSEAIEKGNYKCAELTSFLLVCNDGDLIKAVLDTLYKNVGNSRVSDTMRALKERSDFKDICTRVTQRVAAAHAGK